MTSTKTKKLIAIAMLSALAYLLMVIIKIPVFLFLKYEPKDIIITIGGFIFGPLAAFVMSFIIAFVEMVTVSDTGPIGAIMNFLASCAFACTAAFIYKKRRTLRGAAIGLVLGALCMTGIMILWNYLITPIYMNTDRETVAKMLIPIFLPFNLLKGGLNAAFTMVVYKPLKTALQKSRMLPAEQETVSGSKVNALSIGSSLFVICTCVLIILVLQGKI